MKFAYTLIASLALVAAIACTDEKIVAGPTVVDTVTVSTVDTVIVTVTDTVVVGPDTVFVPRVDTLFVPRKVDAPCQPELHDCRP